MEPLKFTPALLYFLLSIILQVFYKYLIDSIYDPNNTFKDIYEYFVQYLILILILESWLYLAFIGIFFYFLKDKIFIAKLVFTAFVSVFIAWFFDQDGWIFVSFILLKKIQLTLPYLLNAFTLLYLYEYSKKYFKST